MTIRFRKIDDVSRADHYFLKAEDECHYMWEFTAGGGYSAGDNQLITNLKKRPSSSNRAELAYKESAISLSAKGFAGALTTDYLSTVTFVPIPPSKIVGHPDYDNRIERLCRLMGDKIDVRNLVIQNSSMVASHERGLAPRITLGELRASYQIVAELADPVPVHIAVVDDVLTTGTHFQAMKETLLDRFPDTYISGLFVARTIRPAA